MRQRIDSDGVRNRRRNGRSIRIRQGKSGHRERGEIDLRNCIVCAVRYHRDVIRQLIVNRNARWRVPDRHRRTRHGRVRRQTEDAYRVRSRIRHHRDTE